MTEHRFVNSLPRSYIISRTQTPQKEKETMDPSQLAQLMGQRQSKGAKQPELSFRERVTVATTRYGPLVAILACGLYFTRPKPTINSLTRLPI